MDTKNATVPVTVIIKTLNNYARHATSPGEKHMVFTFTEQLAGEIRGIVPGFSETEFLQACGVKPEWATAAA
jgi:hypothetical protein